MVAAGLSALTIHPLLHYCPFPVIGHDEAVQVKIETILHCRAIHFGDQSTGPCQACTVDPDALANRD
jgi:hypothetical protein